MHNPIFILDLLNIIWSVCSIVHFLDCFLDTRESLRYCEYQADLIRVLPRTTGTKCLLFIVFSGPMLPRRTHHQHLVVKNDLPHCHYGTPLTLPSAHFQIQLVPLDHWLRCWHLLHDYWNSHHGGYAGSARFPIGPPFCTCHRSCCIEHRVEQVWEFYLDMSSWLLLWKFFHTYSILLLLSNFSGWGSWSTSIYCASSSSGSEYCSLSATLLSTDISLLWASPLSLL